MRPGVTRILALGGLAALAPGCSSATDAAIGATAVALTASAVSRAQGGCYASCSFGTRCNHETGLCEAVDCGGCEDGEACDAATLSCVPRVVADIRTRPEDPVRTVDQDWARAQPPRRPDLDGLRLFPVLTSTLPRRQPQP